MKTYFPTEIYARLVKRSEIGGNSKSKNFSKVGLMYILQQQMSAFAGSLLHSYAVNNV